MKNKKIKFLLIINFINLIGFQAFAPFYAIFVTNAVGINESMIGLVWGLYSLLIAITLLVMGRLENKLNKEKAIIVGYLILAIAAYLFLFVNSLIALIIVLAFNALGAGIAMPAYKTLFTKFQDKDRESEEWSWLDAGNMIAASIGVTTGGIIVGIFGFNGIFIFMGTIQGIAAIIAIKTFGFNGANTAKNIFKSKYAKRLLAVK